MKSCMLIEMARNIGKPFSMIENKPGYSEKIYDATTTWNKIGDVSSSTTIHYNKDGISDRYVIRDNAANRVSSVHVFDTIHVDGNPHHIVQTSVDREKSTNVIPKQFATKFAYSVWSNQHLPMRSSSEQYETGHKMWRRLVDTALSDNKHVYLKTPTSFTKVTDENKTDAFDAAFGKEREFENNHLILSHMPLTKFEGK